MREQAGPCPSATARLQAGVWGCAAGPCAPGSCKAGQLSPTRNNAPGLGAARATGSIRRPRAQQQHLLGMNTERSGDSACPRSPTPPGSPRCSSGPFACALSPVLPARHPAFPSVPPQGFGCAIHRQIKHWINFRGAASARQAAGKPRTLAPPHHRGHEHPRAEAPSTVGTRGWEKETAPG